jgi:hypothetical protein
MNWSPIIEPLFLRVEAAVDSHVALRRVPGSLGEPELRLSRFGAQIEIRVKLIGSRKKPCTISGDGETPEQAADNLIARLDHWAQAIA